MRFSIQQMKRSAGLTLIEVAAAMTIASVAAIGLGTGITTIAGFFQDDWVTKDVRYWGYECMDYIFEKVETAKRIQVLNNIAKYDGMVITPRKAGSPINIQATEYDGLLVDGQPMLPFARFPSEGIYRGEGQRIVAVESFQVNTISSYPEYAEEFRGRSYLRELIDSLYIIEMVVSVTTKYQGETGVEFVKFKRTIWLKDKYFKAGSS
jgi:hypothetical protein